MKNVRIFIRSKEGMKGILISFSLGTGATSGAVAGDVSQAIDLLGGATVKGALVASLLIQKKHHTGSPSSGKVGEISECQKSFVGTQELRRAAKGWDRY